VVRTAGKAARTNFPPDGELGAGPSVPSPVIGGMRPKVTVASSALARLQCRAHIVRPAPPDYLTRKVILPALCTQLLTGH
jgi:hypothetical protein